MKQECEAGGGFLVENGEYRAMEVGFLKSWTVGGFLAVFSLLHCLPASDAGEHRTFLQRSDFPQGFVFGSSASAYQVLRGLTMIEIRSACLKNGLLLIEISASVLSKKLHAIVLISFAWI